MGSIGCPLCCRHDFISVVALHDHLLYYMYRPLQCAICSTHVGGIQELTHHLERHLGDGVSTAGFHPKPAFDQNTESGNTPFIENGSSSCYDDLHDQGRWKNLSDNGDIVSHQTREEPIELTLRAFFCQTCGAKIVGKDSYFLHIKQHISKPSNLAAGNPQPSGSSYQQETSSCGPSPSLVSVNTVPPNILTDSETVTTEETHEATESPETQLSDCMEEEHVANQLLKLREWQLGKYGRRFRKHHLSFSSSVGASDKNSIEGKSVSADPSPNINPGSVEKVSVSHTNDLASVGRASVENEPLSSFWPSSVSYLSDGERNTEIPGKCSVPSTPHTLISSGKVEDSAVCSNGVLSPCISTPGEQNEATYHEDDHVQLDDCAVSPLDRVNESFPASSVSDDNIARFPPLESKILEGREWSQCSVSQPGKRPDGGNFSSGGPQPSYDKNSQDMAKQTSFDLNLGVSAKNIPFSSDPESIDTLQDSYQVPFEGARDFSDNPKFTNRADEIISNTLTQTENPPFIGGEDKLQSSTHSNSVSNHTVCEESLNDCIVGGGNPDQEPYLHKKFHHDQERKAAQTTSITQNADVNRYIQSIQSLLVNKLNATLNSSSPFKSERMTSEVKITRKNTTQDSNCSAQTEAPPRVYICEVCSLKCSNRLAYAVHCKSHEVEGQKNFTCQYCSKKFYRKRSKDLHVRKHTGEKIHQCTVCSKVFTKLYAFQRHKEEVHACRKNFVCAECSKEFSSQRQLRNHLDLHRCEKIHKCNQCDHACHTASGLRMHKLKNHSNDQKKEEYQCTVCNYCFKKPSGLKRHMQRKHSVPQLKCDLCPKMYSCNEDLLQHRKSHSSEPFRCNHCEKSFTSSWNLQRHKVTHKKKTHPYQCEKCSSKFTRLDSLKSHLNIHSQKKPYVCHCGKRFGKKSQLKSHEDKHSDVAKYICSVCEHSFKFKVSLKNHSCKSSRNTEESLQASST
ncbi:zinc finger protein 235-like isoform X2 [Macrobrachium rosenbergii]|uniref:zinc finger protein 235-like isoform X2 n=1 Tax=Macrobrachium rosenbergii TaxID=79674 RepID=UPI0034D5A3C3